MKDTIIKGTGNSRSLKSVANFLTLYPNYEAFAQAIINGTLPIDIGGLSAAGISQEGTPLNKATLLKDGTARLVGLDTSAVPDDMFMILAAAITSGKKVAIFNAHLEDGSPLSGVRMIGALDVHGETPVTDANGKCVAVLSSQTTVTANTPYLDTNDSTINVPVPADLVSQVDVPISSVSLNTVRYVTASGDYKVSRTRSAKLCLVGAGQGGVNGSNQNTIQDVTSGGIGGNSGKILNVTTTLNASENYMVEIGASGTRNGGLGGNTKFSSFSSENGTQGATPLDDTSIVNIGGNGANGSSGNYSNGTSGGRGGNGGSGSGGGTGGNGGPGGLNKNDNNRANGTNGSNSNGYGGGGGGGGGCGQIASGRGDYPQHGGSGGIGGPGVILVKFLS